MGRGRQKAKQTKVARELKYYSPATDYSQLEKELRGDTTTEVATEDPWSVGDGDDDAYDYSAWEDLATSAEDAGE